MLKIKTGILITGYMLCVSFIIQFIDIQNQPLLTGLFLGAGLILAIIVSLLLPPAAAKTPVRIEEPLVEKEKAKPFNEHAVQMLSILQKNGRLIDFLQEDITSFEDKQIGAAVRNIHKNCKETLEEYLNIEPVVKNQEGDEVIINEGFDPSTIRLTGNVSGNPPFKGTLRHNGWKVSSTNLPDLQENHDLSVLEPAEVEIA